MVIVVAMVRIRNCSVMICLGFAQHFVWQAMASRFREMISDHFPCNWSNWSLNCRVFRGFTQQQFFASFSLIFAQENCRKLRSLGFRKKPKLVSTWAFGGQVAMSRHVTTWSGFRDTVSRVVGSVCTTSAKSLGKLAKSVMLTTGSLFELFIVDFTRLSADDSKMCQGNPTY